MSLRQHLFKELDSPTQGLSFSNQECSERLGQESDKASVVIHSPHLRHEQPRGGCTDGRSCLVNGPQLQSSGLTFFSGDFKLVYFYRFLDRRVWGGGGRGFGFCPVHCSLVT